MKTSKSAESKNDDNPKVDYHRRIKQLREFKNFTQEHMADMLSISQRAYSSIENGQTQLSVERLYEIAEALQVSINEIIGVETQNIYNNNFNNHALHNKGNLVFHQDSFDEQRSLYERLIQSKEEEIRTLREELSRRV